MSNWLWNLKRKWLERLVVKYIGQLFAHTGAARIKIQCEHGFVNAELTKE